MSRPSKLSKSIVIDSDGKMLIWTDGILTGDAALVKEVKLNADIKLPTPISPFGPTVDADLSDINNLAGVLAAMLSANLGRNRILEAPDEVLDLIPLYTETTEYTGEE
jgi:hypothetical protein